MKKAPFEVKHLKTGKSYIYLGYAIECTNGREELNYAIYARAGKVFVREWIEFWEKFEEVEEVEKVEITDQ